MDRFKQMGKGLYKDQQESSQNTRRAQANFPLIERKLDLVMADSSFLMEVPITSYSHSVNLDLRIHPDNCCDCLPGAATRGREATGYSIEFVPSGVSAFDADGIDYPAKLLDPLDQTGTNFNYGYGGPFFYTTYQQFDFFGGYEINPSGGIVVPTDGIYTVMFRDVAGGFAVQGSEVVASIQRMPADKPNQWEHISRKVYSTDRNTLCWHNDVQPASGSWPYFCGEGDFLPGPDLFFGGLYVRVYAYCIPLNKGDTVDGWLQATNVPAWSPGTRGLTRDPVDEITVTLMGLGFGTLVGTVTDVSNSPILGATVSYSLGNGGTTQTDEFGVYSFFDVTPGTYSITASKIGYITQSRDVTVIFNKVASLDFDLVAV